MRPRRPRRADRLPGSRRALRADLIQRLQTAHGLLAQGQPAAAASLFADLARTAETLGRPDRAARLHMQAARGWLEARATPQALDHARASLRLLVESGRAGAASQVLARIRQALLAQGLQAEADQLLSEWETVSPESLPASPAPPAAPPRLPARCPHCGGPLRGDEVEWIDSATAECPYCGGVLGA